MKNHQLKEIYFYCYCYYACQLSAFGDKVSYGDHNKNDELGAKLASSVTRSQIKITIANVERLLIYKKAGTFHMGIYTRKLNV